MRSRIVLVALLIVGGVTMFGGTSRAVSTNGTISSNTGYAHVRDCASTSCPIDATYSNGHRILIYCYSDGGWTSGGRAGQPSTRSNRWFKIYLRMGSYAPVKAWVFANLVYPQPRVPRCVDSTSAP